MTYDELMSALYDLMEEDPEDLEDQVDELLEENDGDPEDAFLAAVQADNFGYVRDHVASIELMTDDGSTSPYVEEAGSEEMRRELIEDGASIYLGDVTDGHDFAWNVETGDVLEESDDFVDGVFATVLGIIGKTANELAEAALAVLEEETGENYHPVPGESYTTPWEDEEEPQEDDDELMEGYTAYMLARLFCLEYYPESGKWDAGGYCDFDEFVEFTEDLPGYEGGEFVISAPHGHGGEWLRWIDKVKD